MSDLRDQLKKAGLVSSKQLRRAKHEQRLHASEAGHAGLEAEKRAEEERFRQESEARRRADRDREEERKRRQSLTEAAERLGALIRGGWIREATAGSHRYFFVTSGDRVSFMDLSETAARRLAAGRAAIVETCGFVRGEFCVVSDKAAAQIEQIRPGILRCWNPAAEGS